jgi:hypothetical protein
LSESIVLQNYINNTHRNCGVQNVRECATFIFHSFNIFTHPSPLSPHPYPHRILFCSRETREWWPLLTVENEVNVDSKSALKGALPWLVYWACRAGTIDFCSALAALGGQVQNLLFHSLCPQRRTSWAGSRAGSPIF